MKKICVVSDKNLHGIFLERIKEKDQLPTRWERVEKRCKTAIGIGKAEIDKAEKSIGLLVIIQIKRVRQEVNEKKSVGE